MRILLVEDEPNLGAAVREHLVSSTHAVDWFLRIDDAEDAVATTSYDLILLDLHLPDGRVLDLLKRLRGRNDAQLAEVNDIIEELNKVCRAINYEPLIEKMHEVTSRDQVDERRYGARHHLEGCPGFISYWLNYRLWPAISVSVCC